MPALATSTRSAALTSTQLCPMASLGSLPVWCGVTVISLQVAGALSSLLSNCMRSLPLISSLQGSAAAWAWVPSASAPSIAAAIVLRIRLIVSSFIGQDCLYGQNFPPHPSVRHSQTLVHQRARGRVLQELLLLRIQMMLDRERGERRLVESGQDQLLLARIGVDVADRKDPGEAGLELLGVDLERLLLERQSP